VQTCVLPIWTLVAVLGSDRDRRIGGGVHRIALDSLCAGHPPRTAHRAPPPGARVRPCEVSLARPNVFLAERAPAAIADLCRRAPTVSRRCTVQGLRCAPAHTTSTPLLGPVGT